MPFTSSFVTKDIHIVIRRVDRSHRLHRLVKSEIQNGRFWSKSTYHDSNDDGKNDDNDNDVGDANDAGSFSFVI